MVRHDTLKHCIWCFKMETFVGYLHFSFVTENRCMVVVFFYYHLKSAFSKHECNKTLTETCICFHEYLKRTIKLKKTYISMLFGQNPFPNKNNTLDNVKITKAVYRNDSVLFNLYESCFTNINYDLKVCFTTRFSLTK